MIISRQYVTFRQLLNAGDEAGTFFVEKLHESYPEDMWNNVWNMLADQCLYQREMGWAFTKLGDVIEKFEELDDKKPYDNGCTYDDVFDAEVVASGDDYVRIHLIANKCGEKIIVKIIDIKD